MTMKRLRASKTVLVNLAVIAAAAFSGVLGADVLSPEYASYVVMALGMVNILLRMVTSKAIKGV